MAFLSVGKVEVNLWEALAMLDQVAFERGLLDFRSDHMRLFIALLKPC